MKRVGYFLYGCVCYLVFVGTLLYAVGFIGNLVCRGPWTLWRPCRLGRPSRLMSLMTLPVTSLMAAMVERTVILIIADERRPVLF
jgi:hypothetical protein